MFPLKENPDMPGNEVWIQDNETGKISAKFRLINVTQDRQTMINTKNLISTLATYNAERDRGIVHTRSWKDEMRKLQEQFNNGELT